MKRTIEIDDTLEERAKDVKCEVRIVWEEFMKENPKADYETFYQEKGVDAVSELADSSTPVYNYEIDGLYFLHGDELDEAYQNAGIGDGKEDNYKQIAICMYLEAAGHEELHKIEEEMQEKVNA